MAIACRMERLIHLCPSMLVLALALVGTSCQSEKPASPEAVAQTSEASTAPSPTPATGTQTPISTAIPSPTPGQPGITGNSSTTVDDHPEFPCGPYFGRGYIFSEHFVFWTPDSSQLVFSSAEGIIWTVGADSSHLNKVLDANPEPIAFGRPGFMYGFHGDLSPDGTQIVYTSCQFPFLHRYFGETEPTRDGPELYDRGRYNYEIAISGLDGSNQQRLTSNERLDIVPVWSPDGSRIAFTSRDVLYYSLDGVINSMTLYLMMADGSNVQSIPLQFDVYGLAPPMWSPDGGRLAVVLTEQNGQRAIYTVQSDGSESVKVAELGHYLTDWKPVAVPTWSPDSERVAFATFDREEWSVYSASFDGTDLRRIWSSGTGEGATAVTLVSWSPDGSEILFVAGGVHVVGVDDNGLRTLISSVGESTKAAWSPDGSMIAVYNPGRVSSIPVVPLKWGDTSYDNIMLATLSRDGTDLRVLVEYDPDLEPRLVQPTRPEATTEPATGSPTPIPAEPTATLGEP